MPRPFNCGLNFREVRVAATDHGHDLQAKFSPVFQSVDYTCGEVVGVAAAHCDQNLGSSVSNLPAPILPKAKFPAQHGITWAQQQSRMRIAPEVKALIRMRILIQDQVGAITLCMTIIIYKKQFAG